MANIREVRVSKKHNLVIALYDRGLRNYAGYIPETIRKFIESKKMFYDSANEHECYYKDNNPGSDYWFNRKMRNR